MKKIVTGICNWIGVRGAIIIFSFASFLSLIGCATSKPGGEAAAGTARPEKSGAELWAENCVRCHNIRSPGSLSPAQWEVALMHMRVRANLTPEEHKKILEFLKSGT